MKPKHKIKNIPKKIYLNLGFDRNEMIQDEDFEVLFSSGEITWCQDKINDADIEYTLQEVEQPELFEKMELTAFNLEKRIAKLEELNKARREYLTYLMKYFAYNKSKRMEWFETKIEQLEKQIKK